MTNLNIRVLRWVSVVGLAVVLLSDLFASLSWKPRQGYGLVLLILVIAAVALVSVVLMPRATGTLVLHCNILLPLALLVFADRLIGWLGGLPVLGAMLTPSWPLQLFNLSFAVSVHFLMSIGFSVAYAAWMTTAVLALVRREQDDPCAALPSALRQFWRVLGLEFIGWAVILLATALLLLLMPVIGFSALVLMAIFATSWNFATAAVLPVMLANGSGFPEAFRTGVRVSLGNLGKWWLLLLAQMLLLGLFVIIYSNWTDGGTRHGNVSWHVNAFWTGGFENECRWYGKLAESFHFPKLPLVETLLALLFGVMAVAVKIAIVQRLPVKESSVTP